MQRFFPHPVTSVLVFITWLVQSDPRTPGPWIMGLVLAWALPYLTRRLWTERIRVRSLPRIVVYIGIVIWDVFKSNMRVTWLILTQSQKLHPVLVKVPLTIRDTYGIATLAATISYTPGTVAVDVSEDRSHLLVHVFHTHDPRGVVHELKERYERRLLEIFPC
jgi:multicomponent K+:H+ antiporter subunit E